ncbi:hypothetical protein MKX01_036722 [Papaver californicum]|nr:hypothetical protein MKX01_036722 [Papaver californicum]
MKGLGGVVLLFMLLNLTKLVMVLGGNVEGIIRDIVRARFVEDPTIAAAFLRLQFHDCFGTGCDASLLLNGPRSEKTAGPNLSVRGYDLIDAAKASLEKACPVVVSCSDIVAVATRDAVFLVEIALHLHIYIYNTSISRSIYTYILSVLYIVLSIKKVLYIVFNMKLCMQSKGMNYRVQTGRRDGFVSLKENVNLPSPSITVKASIDSFRAKGLNKTDMVLLLGAHTVGITHCALIRSRLYNFRNTGKRDPTMDANLFKLWSNSCPKSDTGNGNAIALDQTINSTNIVDNGYFKQIKVQRGVLEIDQGLGIDRLTADVVGSYADGPLSKTFQSDFGAAMIKLGGVGVLTKPDGEIRKTCGFVNPKGPTKPKSAGLPNLLF